MTIDYFRCLLSSSLFYTGDVLFGTFSCQKVKGDKRSLDITMDLQHFIGNSTTPNTTSSYHYIVQ